MPDVPSSRWSDLAHPALDGSALSDVLTGTAPLWRPLEVVPEIGSANAELAARATRDPEDGGAPEGAVLVAEHQVSGRGRPDRTWTSRPRAGITVSFLLRRDVPAARRGWVPLLTGVALAESVAEVAGVLPSLKWPNDLLAVDGRKLTGILAETSGTAVVVGVGLNVSTATAELPETATSLASVLGPRSTARRCSWRSCARWNGGTGGGPASWATPSRPGWPGTTWRGRRRSVVRWP